MTSSESRTPVRRCARACYTFPAWRLLPEYSSFNEVFIAGETRMPATPHTEHHFTATEAVRDVVIGMSDGLTVPFALAAGISGAVASSPHASALVVTAGLAEIAAGSIAMGLGGYLAAKTDQEHYESERQREITETHEKPEQEAREVAEVFENWGLTSEQIVPIV